MTGDVLARRVALLLRAYPAAYRAERGAEIAATMLDVAVPGQRWPSLREAGGVLVGAARVRARSTSLAPSTLIRDALQLAVVGIAVPTLAYNFWGWGTLPNLTMRGQIVAWAVPYAVLLALTVATALGAYGTALGVLAGSYVAHRWFADWAVDTVPVRLNWGYTWYVAGAMLVALLVWRVVRRDRHRAPVFSGAALALAAALVPLLDRVALTRPEGGGPWWLDQLIQFGPFLLLLAFAWVDPRIPLAGAMLAVLWKTYLIETLLYSESYSRNDVLWTALTLYVVLAVAVVMVATSVLARWRLVRP
jgi:hypothetical protein